MAMSDSEHVPGHPLEQATVVDVHPREGGGEYTCSGCGEVRQAHICHGDVWMCSECCPDASAGEGKCQRMIGRERAGAGLVNRRHIPTGWGEPHQWPVDREVVDIGRAGNGQAVLTNTEPGADGWLGNPYKLKGAGGEYSREESVARYREVFYRMAAQSPEFREYVAGLHGTILMGWCVPALCHGDVILEWLDLHGPGGED